jgi:dihydroorotate dehydrogenase electron transfer subunit
MAKRIQDFTVLENKQIGKDFYILELLSQSPLPEILPGQFVQIRIDGSPETFLRRPFSVYDADHKVNILKLLYQVVGKGTETMSSLSSKNLVNLVYPLGNSFSDPSEGGKVILIGGGVGIAPFLYFAKHLKEIKCEVEMLFGFRNSERIIDYDDFTQYGKVHITTEDGSAGEKGLVTNHSVLANNKYNRIYCCGPDPMMKAVAGYATARGIFCEVSLENLMGCGFGICLCCIVATSRGNICTCTEGPVFNINELKW